MAYPIFSQPQGPDIKVSLFSDAQSRGINAGNAQKTPLQAGIEGVTQGIQTGIGITQGIQQIGLNSQQAELNEAKIAQAKQQTEIQGIENQVILNNQETYRIAKENQLKEQAAESEQKLADIQNVTRIGEILATGTPEKKAAILTDKKYTGTLLRDDKLATKVIGNLASTPGVSPELVKQARQTYDAVELEKQQYAFAKQNEAAQVQLAKEREKEYAPAFGYLQANSPEFVKAVKSNTPPANLKVYKKSDIQITDEGRVVTENGQPKLAGVGSISEPGYVLLDGDRVIQNIAEDDGKDFKKNLEIYKTYTTARFPRMAGSQTETLKQDEESAPATRSDLLGQSSGDALASNILGQGEIPATQNASAVERARSRHAKAKANAKGTAGAEFTKLTNQGANIAHGRASQAATSYVNTPQNAPQNPDVPAVTTPVAPISRVNPAPQASIVKQNGTTVVATIPDTAAAGSGVKPLIPNADGRAPIEQGLSQISASLGGVPVTANLTVPKEFRVRPADVENINAQIPDRSAVMKGLVLVESRGNPRAVSKAGAAGLTQLMPAAAKDVGLTSAERFDPEKNIEGGEEYLQKQYDDIQPAIAKAFEKQRQYERYTGAVTTAISNQGVPQVPDPRFILASYNGGLKYVLDGINKGNTTWPQMVEYLRSVKNPKAFKENSEYADKVITASLSFIKGGNASDDAYVQTLLNFDIVGTVGV